MIVSQLNRLHMPKRHPEYPSGSMGVSTGLSEQCLMGHRISSCSTSKLRNQTHSTARSTQDHVKFDCAKSCLAALNSPQPLRTRTLTGGSPPWDLRPHYARLASSIVTSLPYLYPANAMMLVRPLIRTSAASRRR